MIDLYDYNPNLPNILSFVKGRTAILISAFDDQYSFAQNMEHHKQLLIDARSNHLGFIELINSYDDTVSVHGEEIIIPVTKYSVFIPYFSSMNKSKEEFRNVVLSLTNSLEIEIILFVKEGNATLENRETSEQKELGEFSLDTLNTYFCTELAKDCPREAEFSFAEGLCNIFIRGTTIWSGMGISNSNKRILHSRSWDESVAYLLAFEPERC